jgi:NAD(P)-dependent dehydrogenase (short-subunit alcohol dehydrogenase family)
MASLAGKTAVVLGASGSANFGSAIARRLAAEGANIVVSARRAEPLTQLASELGGTAVQCDVTREGDIEQLFKGAVETHGRVDIAVFSAGIHSGVAIADLTAETIRPTAEISFIGALLFFRYAAEAMREGGSVITISSLTARIPGPGLAVYSAARAGIDYAIKVAAVEYGERKVRFNSIAAGLIQTDMTDGFFSMQAIIDAHINATPCGRMGTLDDMAEAALFLADDRRSGYINGQVLDLAGGQQNGRLPRF